jgi:hypothetical protein
MLLSIVLGIVWSLAMLQRIIVNRATSQRPHKRIEAFGQKKMTNFLEEYFQKERERAWQLRTRAAFEERKTTEGC